MCSSDLEDKKKLIYDIKEVCRLIACNERWFDLEIDDNLIDACIYERQSLFSHYKYLIKLAKNIGLNCNTLQNNSMGV